MMIDPGFLREATKHQFELDFMPGEELHKFIAAVGGFPPELRDKAKKILMHVKLETLFELMKKKGPSR